MSKRILYLTLKKQWFDMIASGQKLEEYREIKPYWDARLHRQHYDQVVFRHGYSPNAPSMTFEVNGIEKKFANPDWCGGHSPWVYAIKLGKRIN